MADSTKKTLKQKFESIYKFEQIRKDISQENVTELSKDRLQECCKELKLKVAGEKKELIERLQQRETLELMFQLLERAFEFNQATVG